MKSLRPSHRRVKSQTLAFPISGPNYTSPSHLFTGGVQRLGCILPCLEGYVPRDEMVARAGENTSYHSGLATHHSRVGQKAIPVFSRLYTDSKCSFCLGQEQGKPHLPPTGVWAEGSERRQLMHFSGCRPFFMTHVMVLGPRD